MTEAEWLACADVRVLWDHLGEGRTERKARLFACACVRTAWHLLADERSEQAIAFVERLADGLAKADEAMPVLELAHSAYSALREATPPGPDTRSTIGAARRWFASAASLTLQPPRELLRAVAIAGFALHVEQNARSEPGSPQGPVIPGHRLEQCLLLRDIFNPFRSDPLRASRLTATVISLAQAAYDERIVPKGELEPARLAVLSDAIEEAGCTDAAILSHLRSPGPHVRGCWGIDLILDKE
jgi:hypothetical protein